MGMPIDVNVNIYATQGRNLEELKSSFQSQKTVSKDDAKMRKAANEFEAVFVKQFMDTLDSTIEKSDFMRGGNAEETFKSMLNEQIATDISTNPNTSFGLADQIYRQMKDKY